jgi:hypothetical protein
MWVDIVVAQFRYDLKKREWTLYSADRRRDRVVMK